MRLRLAAEQMQDANRACALRKFADLLETQACALEGIVTETLSGSLTGHGQQ